MSKPVKIDPEIHQLIPALTEVEYQQLKVNLLDDGCLDALIVWDEQDILLDGHNRLSICQDHKLPYDVTRLSFPDRGSAIEWVINHQLGRRNLTEKQRDYLIGERYLREKQSHGGDRGNQYKKEARDNNCPLPKTYDRLAEEYGVHANTIKNNAKFAEDTNTLMSSYGEEVKEVLLSGELTKKDVATLRAIHEEDPARAEAIITELTATCEEGNTDNKHSSFMRQQLVSARKEQRRQEAQQLDDGIYNVIYADPPWEYRNSGLEGSAASHYNTMPTEEICVMQIPSHENAVLFLWATNPLLPDALQVIERWGFSYKSNMVWVKPYRNYGKSGWYVMGQHELLLIATRGQCTPEYQPPSVLEHERLEHSQKPPLYGTIEKMYPYGRYLELFARNPEPRDHWTFWGDQA